MRTPRAATVARGFLLVKLNVWDKSRNYHIFVIVTIKRLEDRGGLTDYVSIVKR